MLDSAPMREKLFTMRMSAEESERLEAVARHYGLNAAGVLRMLIKREFDSIRHNESAKADGKSKKR